MSLLQSSVIKRLLYCQLFSEMSLFVVCKLGIPVDESAGIPVALSNGGFDLFLLHAPFLWPPTPKALKYLEQGIYPLGSSLIPRVLSICSLHPFKASYCQAKCGGAFQSPQPSG